MQAQIKTKVASAEYYTAECCYINELSNQAHDPAVSIAEARVKPGVTTRLHRLHGISERYVVLAGCGFVAVGGLPMQQVNPGDVVLIPPGCAQQISNTGQTDLVFLAICSPRFQQHAYEDIEPE